MSNATQLFGISVEVANTMVAIKVTNSDGISISNALVMAYNYGLPTSIYTDTAGNAVLWIRPELTNRFYITKDGYTPTTILFKALADVDLPNDTNFPFMVVDQNHAPISDASITITRTRGSESSSQTGTSNTKGIFEGVYEFGWEHSVEISHPNYQTLTMTLETYVELSCPDVELNAVPLMVLS